ncbi:6-phosphogluconate dehydrogenase [Striga asiatica]|uniref:6-phosphogluconate dehydrogenase n=1 Tax=Striga asiatica TaxID=4170 RepID=A0A5A7RDT5_STRAF|nr:6-phosphogluconate dehydrogenase [Striga asiatica]GER57319.1 6-phosphogluconate dehydrogenase [Striga asiatica]
MVNYYHHCCLDDRRSRVAVHGFVLGNSRKHCIQEIRTLEIPCIIITTSVFGPLSNPILEHIVDYLTSILHLFNISSDIEPFQTRDSVGQNKHPTKVQRFLNRLLKPIILIFITSVRGYGLVWDVVSNGVVQVFYEKPDFRGPDVGQPVKAAWGEELEGGHLANVAPVGPIRGEGKAGIFVAEVFAGGHIGPGGKGPVVGGEAFLDGLPATHD